MEQVTVSVVPVPEASRWCRGRARAPEEAGLSAGAMQTLPRAGLGWTGWFPAGVFWVVGRKTKCNQLPNELQQLVTFDL